MITIDTFVRRIKDVTIYDYLSIPKMMLAYMLRPFYKKYLDSWLICDTPKQARDNGYHFFKYVCENHPSQKCYFAIEKGSMDYKKVQVIGDVVTYGSLKHWLLFFLCQYNISSEKGGKPNAAICAFLELSGIFVPRNIFLQHGVTINDAKWLYAKNSRIHKFITATVPETSYILKKFGYPKDAVCMTGFPRFDALHNNEKQTNQILIMPSWRAWLAGLSSEKKNEKESDLATSEYVTKWKEFLNSKELGNVINEYKVRIMFFPHKNIQPYIYLFADIVNPITIASDREYDVQELLKQSSMMITDYSSVFFDMVYMEKPIIFYQFDEDKFHTYQYETGWFDYHNNPFGNTYSDYHDVIDELRKILDRGFEVSEEFMERKKQWFSYYDRNNSERVYQILKLE